MPPRNTDETFVCFSCSSMNEIQPEGVTNESPTATERKDDLFSGSKNQDMAEDCTQTESTQGDESSQDMMDCGSVGGLNESVTPGNKSNTAQTHYSNGQKTKRSSSPGPHPVKASCVAPNQSDKSITKCANTHCDVDMQSPDSLNSKGVPVSSSLDKDQFGAMYALDCSLMESQVMESQLLDTDSECSSKDKTPRDDMGKEEAEASDCSGTCEMMSQEVSDETVERY